MSPGIIIQLTMWRLLKYVASLTLISLHEQRDPMKSEVPSNFKILQLKYSVYSQLHRVIFYLKKISK